MQSQDSVLGLSKTKTWSVAQYADFLCVLVTDMKQGVTQLALTGQNQCSIVKWNEK